MKLQEKISIYGENNKGVILFFSDSHKNESSYNSFLYRLSGENYEVIFIPHDDLIDVKDYIKIIRSDNIIVFSHGDGCKNINNPALEGLKIKKTIISAPTRDVSKYIKGKTLVLWSDGDKKYHHEKIANSMFFKLKNNHAVSFIGYPHVSFYLFGGVHYSQYHDKIDQNKKYTIFNKDKYDHLSQTVVQDIIDFLNDVPQKEKIVITSDNYLPFSSGVNILVSLLKEELTKLNKRVYVLTYKLKGVDYCYAGAEENVITLPCFYMPGKKNKSDCLVGSFRGRHNARYLYAYDFDYIHQQTEFTISFTAYRLKKKLNIPSLYTAQTMWHDMFNKRYPKWFAKIVISVVDKMFIRPPIKINDAMTVPTFKVLKYYEKEWNSGDKVVVIPGCVDNDRFALKDGDERVLNHLRSKYNLYNKKVLGYVGRVSPEKHINIVVEYFDKIADHYPDLVFMIVGSGPYIEDLKKQIDNSTHKDRFVLTGNVPNRAIKYYYRLFDCFCTASTFETQGLTYIEAMWCKAPLLVKRDTCLDDFLVDGVNGLIFDDYDSWKNGLDKILSNKNFKNKMVQEAFITASGYEKAVWAKKIYFLYEECRRIKNKEKATPDYVAMRKIK